jgi:hypothetical protein
MLATLVGAFPFGPLPPRTPPQTVNPVIIGRMRSLLKAGQVCAIPLVNVLPRRWTGDRRFVVPVPAPVLPKDVMAPPAPSCDDVR